MIQCFCGMVHDAARHGYLGALWAPAIDAGPAPKSAGPADAALIQDLVDANHILCDQGVVDGFGHVSARHDKDPIRYLLARSMAPALVTADDIRSTNVGGGSTWNASSMARSTRRDPMYRLSCTAIRQR